MTPTTKQLLNSLSCPVCGGQIDIGGKNHYMAKPIVKSTKPQPVIGYRSYGCANNNAHYTLMLTEDSLKSTSTIYLELVIVNDGAHQYEIEKQLGGDKWHTKIVVRSTDAEHRVIYRHNDAKLNFDFSAFDFRNFDVNKAIARIKTMMVFQ